MWIRRLVLDMSLGEPAVRGLKSVLAALAQGSWHGFFHQPTDGSKEEVTGRAFDARPVAARALFLRQIGISATGKQHVHEEFF